MVNDNNINELTFQIHFNQIKDCSAVLFNLGWHQLLLSYRDSTTQLLEDTRTHTHIDKMSCTFIP